MKYLIPILLLFIISCKPKSKDTEKPVLENYTTTIQYKLKGDFDGDGKMEYLVSDLISRKEHQSIDSFPNPYVTNMDDVMEFFYKQDANLILTSTSSPKDTLEIGKGRGFFHFVNMGDLNGDQKDEVALVAKYMDHSSVNSCSIYSLCSDGWKTLFSFGVHESAFYFEEGEEPYKGEGIKGFLEKRDEGWYFKDYYKDVLGEMEESDGDGFETLVIPDSNC